MAGAFPDMKVDELYRTVSVAARDPSCVEYIPTISYANTLAFKEKIIDEFGTEMDSTTNLLDFVQEILFNAELLNIEELVGVMMSSVELVSNLQCMTRVEFFCHLLSVMFCNI
ncbi:hypothetical protein V6N11_003104 [Hibiscus sabdariffa]|uniref:Uncharacterized protein n=1 Tax=Hibiscus sabdariffa TaxID=183260 RepID=A0ABR2SCP0_9ROSI